MKLRWLLFKQGFKSMFRFKLQFIIIVLLSFLSSFYLVATFSTNTRINSLYSDVIVDNGKIFDYMEQKNMMGPNSTMSDASDIYIEMNDFINDNYVSTTLADGSTSTAANFMLKKNNGVESFVTRAFDSNEWKEIFASQYLSLAKSDDAEQRDKDYTHMYSPSDNWEGPIENTQSENGVSDLGSFLTRVNINKGTGEIDYAPLQLARMSSLNESFNLGPHIDNNVSDRLKRFTAMTTGVLMNSFIAELKDKKENLSPYTAGFGMLPLAYEYYLSNNDAYNKLMKVWDAIQYPVIEEGRSITTTNWYKNGGWYALDGIELGNTTRNDLDKVRWIKNDPNFVYVYTALNSLSYELLNNIIVFEQNAWSSFTADPSFIKANTSQNRGQQLSQSYSEFYNKNLSLIYADDMTKEKINTTESALSQHMITDYEYLFGEDLINNNHIGTLSVENISGLKGKKTDEAVIGENQKISFTDNDHDNSYEQNMSFGTKYDHLKDMKNYDKFKYGLRGMTNPINYALSGDNTPLSLNVNESYDIIGRYDAGKSFSASRGGIEYDYNKFDTSISYIDPREWAASQASVLAMEKMHQDMAADVTHFTLNFREEASLYDSSSKISYRFVILDDNEIKNGGQYLKLIEGTMPTTANQILIGEQFAFKNNLKMGQTINIGGVHKIVSGYATDTLSYYPLTNLDVPSPDIKNGAIVYLTKESLRTLVHTAGISDALTMKNYYFTTKKADVSNENMLYNIKMYNALTNTNLKKMNVAHDILQNDKNSKFWNSDWQNGSEISTFNSTPFYDSWTIQPLFSNIMKILAVLISGLILILSFVAIAFGIRKNIQANSSQIACMKSIGVRSYELAFSYVSYSIIIGLIVVPLAWIVGGMAQELIVRMFMQYICTPLFQFVFSWKIILSLMFGMGGLSFIFSAIIAIIYNRQKISKIINGSFVNRLGYKDKKHPLFDRLSFNSRFDLKIARRSIGSLVSVATTTLILTTLITSFTFLPTMFSKYISDSEKFFKYDNSYLSNSPYANSPLSAPSIDAWSGADYLDSVNRGSEMNGTEMQDYAINYFPSITQYGDSNINASPLPTFKMSSTSDSKSDFDKNVEWTGEYLYSKKDNTPVESNTNTNTTATNKDKPPYEPNNSLLMMILNSTLGKAANMNGFSLSMGDLEQYAMVPMYTVKNTNGSNLDFINTEERRQALVQSMSALKDGLPNLLETIFPDISDIPKSDDWRKSLFYLLETYLPSEITSNLVSNTKTSEFNLSASAENFVPGKETLGTYAKIKDSSGKIFGIDGLKDNQLVYRLSPSDTKNVFLDNETINELTRLFNGQNSSADIEDLVSKRLYDNDSSTLYIPVVINKSVNKTFKFSNNLSAETNYLSLPKMEGKGFKTDALPSGAWIYDDSDYNRFLNPNDKSKVFLDPYGMQSSNFDFERQYKKTDNNQIQLLQDTNIFEQLKFKDGEPSWEIRPFYNYNNMRIYIPKVAVPGGALSITNGSSVDVSTKVENDTDPLSNQTGWYGEENNNNNIPNSVKSAWKNIYGGSGDVGKDGWFWIAPYNLKYNKLYNGNNADNRFGEVTIADFMAAGTLTFGVENIGSSDQYALRTITGPLENPNIKHIKLLKKSVLKTYNDSVIVADQDLVNLLMGYTTDKFLPIDVNPFSDSVGTYELSNGAKMNEYNFKTIDELRKEASNNPYSLVYGTNSIYKGDERGAVKYGTQDKWYNMKYSGYEEPTSITGGIKTILNGGVGFVNTGAINGILGNFTSSYKEIKLSSLRIGLIISISRIILSVSIFSILGVIVISILFLILLSDAFITRYARFMLVMKALGYTKWGIARSIIGIQSIVSLIMIALGIVIGDQIIQISLNYSSGHFDLNIPHVVFWWLPIIIIAGIIGAFAIAFSISLSKSLKEKPYKLFKD